MAFRKRNVAVGKPGASPNESPSRSAERSGVRPSSLTSQPVTSTGCSSLDDLLGGHAGLALGSSLLVEESGTTDFAGALLKYYAAEGLCHGHVVHVVGVDESWIRELPAVSEGKGSRQSSSSTSSEERMKIAWRYESLGQAGDRALASRLPMTGPDGGPTERPFCHPFDLTKRFTAPADARVDLLPLKSPSAPFDSVIQSLRRTLQSSAPGTVHRLVVPTILSPALWPPNAGHPENFLRFLHALQALLQEHTNKLTAMMTLPLELHSRSSGLVRWAERLSDGVLELTPFPHLMDASNSLAESGGARGKDEQPQGMLKVHKLPVVTERGEGGAGVGNTIGEDLAFTVSRRKFEIKPFSLPPAEGDQEAQKEGASLTGKDVEF